MILNRATALLGSVNATRLLCARSLKTRTKRQAEEEANQLLDKLYNEVRAQRFSQIVVIQTKFDADPRYLILANAFNSRHLLSGTENVNKYYKKHMKTEDHSFANLSLSREWNVLDFHSVVVHLLSEDCRKHFDMDQLWAVGEKYDDQCQRIGSKSQQHEDSDKISSTISSGTILSSLWVLKFSQW